MRLQRYLDCARLNGQVIRLLARNRWVRPGHVARSYDRLATDYDQSWLLHLLDTTRHLLDGLPDGFPPGDFLDLGCGTGFAALQLAPRHPAHAILACDLSPGMVAEARTRPGADAIEWHVADMLAFLAARAGEAGKGFAVVAEEVRNLARRAADAARTTAELIEAAQHHADSSVSMVDNLSTTFTGIEESSGKVATLVSEIAEAAKEQTQGIEQINTGVAEMDSVVQQNAANAEEIASASQELSTQAEDLDAMIAELLAMVEGSRSEQPLSDDPPPAHDNRLLSAD